MSATSRITNHSNSIPSVDVLLVTVTEVEANAVFDVFTPDQEKKRHHIGKNTYYDLGEHGNARVFMVQSEMGAGGLAGSQATVQASIEALCPDSVVMVGIAFGTNAKRQKIGDILVSRQLMFYEPQHVGTDRRGRQKRIFRGERAHASVRLVDRFVAGMKDWTGQKVRSGLILSGEKLVDNLQFRQELHECEPEAIGGEMEGAGLYAAAQRAEVDWLLVKAICDWANGHKSRNKEQNQQMAAGNAAQFALHVCKCGGLVTSRQDNLTKAVLRDIENLRKRAEAWKDLHKECHIVSHQLVSFPVVASQADLETKRQEFVMNLGALKTMINEFVRLCGLTGEEEVQKEFGAGTCKNLLDNLQSGKELLDIAFIGWTAKKDEIHFIEVTCQLRGIESIVSQILSIIDKRLQTTLKEL